MFQVIIDGDCCKGCLICMHACPGGVFTLGDRRSRSGVPVPEPGDGDSCLGCRLCERLCPEMCIEVTEDE
jgi:2-oxoglutarate ferredoxin oxidoreductase subunit delta